MVMMGIDNVISSLFLFSKVYVFFIYVVDKIKAKHCDLYLISIVIIVIVIKVLNCDSQYNLVNKYRLKLFRKLSTYHRRKWINCMAFFIEAKSFL